MAASLPLAATVLLLLLGASAVPAIAGAKHGGGARMVIITRRAPGTTAGRVGGGRLLEDELEPEFGGLLGAGGGGDIGYGALDKGRTGCQSSSQCAAKGGGSYTRGCTYENRCPH